MKDAAAMVAVDCQEVRTRTDDVDALRDKKLTVGKRDDAGEAGCVDGVAVRCNGKRVTQRARATVGGAGDGDRGRVRHILPTNTVVISGLSITNGALLSREVLFS